MADYMMVQEASTLRAMLMQTGQDAFAPGRWPRQIKLDGVVATAVAQKRDAENELVGVVYEAEPYCPAGYDRCTLGGGHKHKAGGPRILVLND